MYHGSPVPLLNTVLGLIVLFTESAPRPIQSISRNVHVLCHQVHFYHGLLPVGQSHGHGASCFIGGALTLGEVGFGETMGQCRVGPCFYKIVELVGGGSVIKGAYPV